MTNLINDISTLTTIQERVLNRLLDIAQYCINETIEEDISQCKTISEFDLGIGQLFVQYCDNELKFKFIPSAKLKENIVTTIKNGHSDLELVLNDNLVSRITNTYKDIM